MSEDDAGRCRTAGVASLVRRVLRSDLAPGVALLAATAAAPVWVNSLDGDGYTAPWNTELGRGRVADGCPALDQRRVDDGVPSVIGLEIKHELVAGQPAHPRQAAAPAAQTAALGPDRPATTPPRSTPTA